MKSILNKILLILLLLMTIFNTGITIYLIKLYHETKLTDLSILYTKTSSKIYDQSGNLLVDLSSKYTSFALYEEIPEDLINAFLSTEDSHFFEHNGIDILAIIRSLLVNIKEQDFKEGASTITQQLVKNIYLSNEKSIDRKLNEIILALKLENILTKEDIIASYLSNVLFGGKVYGVKMASKYYFDKELMDLNLVECAFLAGMVQMPNYYNPFTNIDGANTRKNIVLKRMYEEGYIESSLYESLILEDLSIYLKKGSINENLGIYASYIDYVEKELNTNYNLNLYKDDIDITINVDSEIQTYIYEIMNNKYSTFPDEYLKAGIIVLDSKTSNILAIGGSRESGLKNLNYATDVLNQPGSTIKPILSYAPAIEYLNYQPQTQINDEVYYYNDGMRVNNWDNRYLGFISTRYALSNSRNVPAIKLYNLVGSDLSWQYANSVGLINRDGFTHESLAIGGFQDGFTVLEMTNSYIPFANSGKYRNATSINYLIKDKQKLEIKNPYKQVLSIETAFLITDILGDVLKGTKYDITYTDFGSKTGQSNYDYDTRMKYNIPANSTKDSWIIAYTPSITVGIWCGYNNLKNGKYLDNKTKDIPIIMMKMIMDKFSGYNEWIKVPKSLKIMEVEIIDGLIYQKGSTKGIKDYFYSGFNPLSRENLDYDKT